MGVADLANCFPGKAGDNFFSRAMAGSEISIRNDKAVRN